MGPLFSRLSRAFLHTGKILIIILHHIYIRGEIKWNKINIFFFLKSFPRGGYRGSRRRRRSCVALDWAAMAWLRWRLCTFKRWGACYNQTITVTIFCFLFLSLSLSLYVCASMYVWFDVSWTYQRFFFLNINMREFRSGWWLASLRVSLGSVSGWGSKVQKYPILVDFNININWG